METGFDNDVLALGLYDGDLIAAGKFTSTGSGTINRIARWSGSTWLELGSGIGTESYEYVAALTAWNGSLYAAGNFSSAGGDPADYIASWDGARWTEPGGGLGGYATGLTTHDNAVIACGVFVAAGDTWATRIAFYDGIGWGRFGTGASYTPDCLASLEGNLFVGGEFNMMGSKTSQRFAKWTVPPASIEDDVATSVGPRIRLTRVAPNPSRGLVEVTYWVAAPGPVRMSVLDPAGRRIATRVDGAPEAGIRTARWDLTRAAGARIPAGVYFLRLEALGETRTLRAIRVR
jgi:hypothetical protein